MDCTGFNLNLKFLQEWLTKESSEKITAGAQHYMTSNSLKMASKS